MPNHRFSPTGKPLCWYCRCLAVYFLPYLENGKPARLYYCETHASERGYQAFRQPLQRLVEVTHA